MKGEGAGDIVSRIGEVIKTSDVPARVAISPSIDDVQTQRRERKLP
jgi:hypothetical protein